MRDWNDLRLILELARARSLAGAARALEVNHATVSRQLARLEARVGHRYFDRVPTGLRPTPEGEVAAARAEAMEVEAIALDLELAARAGEDRGVLRVTVPPLLADRAFAEDIAIWRAAHPRAELMILGDNRILNLHRREADIAIRIQNDPSETLWGRKITDQRAGLFATAEFVARHGAALSGQGGVPIIAFTAWDRPIAPAILAEVPNAQVAATCDDMLAAVSLVAAGIGFTRMPCFVSRAVPGLVRLPGTGLSAYPPVWVLTHPDLRRAPLVAGFLRLVAGRYSGRAAHYLGAED